MTTTPAATGHWLIRTESQPTPHAVDHPQQVLQGLRDGLWDTTDEVRGPTDAAWTPIEDHPMFEELVAEMGPPPPLPHDETHLDMNPLIDVSLVLLIFFILTSAVATMRRTIDLPPPPSEDKATKAPTKSDIQDRIFEVLVSLGSDEAPVVTINDRVIVTEQLNKEMKEIVRSTGRKEMYLTATDDVTWDTLVQVHGAANEAGVTQIHMKQRK